MKSYLRPFNLIYLALLPLLAAAGCASDASDFAKKEQSTMRFYVEGSQSDKSGTGNVLVTRQHYPYTIESEPFLTEADIRQVAMVDEPGPDGGFAIQIGLSEHGALAMEMITTLHKGRHIVIYSQFPPVGYKSPEEKKKSKKAAAGDDTGPLQMREPLPPANPEADKPGDPRRSAWLAAVLIRDRNTSGLFRFSPDATREETARIVRGLKNDIAYEKSLETLK